jgi:hypothetical protein
MVTMDRHELELDGVLLAAYGSYYEGMSGDYFNPPEPEEFSLDSVHIEEGDVEIDVTDLLYNRLEEIEEIVMNENYR